MSQWTVLANFASGLEADIAVERLLAEEVPAHSRGRDIVGVVGPGFQGPTPRGFDVMVPDDLVEEAREILGLDPEKEA